MTQQPFDEENSFPFDDADDPGGYVSIWLDRSAVTLDGAFTAEQLERIAAQMRRGHNE